MRMYQKNRRMKELKDEIESPGIRFHRLRYITIPTVVVTYFEASDLLLASETRPSACVHKVIVGLSRREVL